ncbi:hypothetical protein [Halobacillus campisalis]|uniref:Glycosyl-4,4'-diaponeurosporenoate acyltransferase n=1 Tax=Halobacillus campisalis TaxID=435909 RepID=A0ABW2K1K2_9BACI|nr:hypothetical protein [Halobacillus campisalis]
MTNIKNYNISLISFVFVNLALLGLDSYLSIIYDNMKPELLLKSLPIPSIVTLLTLVLNGIIPSDYKYKLVFWRWSNPLPGSRLKKIINKDHRVSIDQISLKFGDIPDEPKQQNMYWYQKIFKPNQESEKILDVHKKFLLTRDITAISFMIFIISIVNAIIFNGTFIHIVIVLVEYITFSLVSSNYGRRFVATTIAEAV